VFQNYINRPLPQVYDPPHRNICRRKTRGKLRYQHEPVARRHWRGAGKSDDEFTKNRAPGYPQAPRQKPRDTRAADRIIAVGQEEKGHDRRTVGWRDLTEVVKFASRPKGLQRAG